MAPSPDLVRGSGLLVTRNGFEPLVQVGLPPTSPVIFMTDRSAVPPSCKQSDTGSCLVVKLPLVG